jgi:hypothetical protein
VTIIRSLLWCATVLVLLAAPALGNPPSSQPAREPDGTWITPFQAFPIAGDDEPMFTGEYTVERKGGLLREIQIYRDMQGKVVHRVESLYDEVNQRPVFYESDDFVNGYASVARVLNTGVEYEIRDTDGKVVKSGRYERVDGTYLWPNLVQLVEVNWDNVITGKPLEVELFFSSLGTSLAVQVAADGKAIVNGNEGKQFTVSAVNPFVRMATKPVRLIFSTDGARRLLALEGRSVVSSPNHKSLDLRIVFGTRKPG